MPLSVEIRLSVSIWDWHFCACCCTAWRFALTISLSVVTLMRINITPVGAAGIHARNPPVCYSFNKYKVYALAS